ncbi:helix-turn-helix domain-containing protein [Paenibacillus flagellatus]|uniref:helix-turn-helix domain-containing protein n=1 Tax=Paenibacillus flagellatus TaxID=2211139 RepID=UPI00130530B7|nr:helix-turn-helix domain-containing protein [Paenibacillus flagellatus]
MNFFKLYATRKYLRRLLATMIVIMVALVTSSSLLLYFKSERTVLHMQSEANLKILSQIDYNIASMNESVKNMAISVFFDTDTIPLLYGADENVFELPSKLLKLDHLASSNPYLHAITIFNANSDTFYSTDMLFQQDADGLLRRFGDRVREDDSIPQLQLIPLQWNADADRGESHRRPVDLFVYSVFMPQNGSRAGGTSSKVLLTVKPEWLFDNLHLLNELSGNARQTILIMNAQGEWFVRGGEPLAFEPERLSRAVLEHSQQANGSFTFRTDDALQMVSFKKRESNGWYLVSIQPYEAALGDVFEMRGSFALIAFMLVLFSIMASFPLSRRLYKPIEKLLRQARSPIPAAGLPLSEAQDELAYITQAMNDIEKDRENQSDTLVHYRLRKLLADSPSFDADSFRELTGKPRVRIDPSGGYVVAVAKIDDFKTYSRLAPADRRLHPFAIGNIATEIVSSRFETQFIDMKSDHFGLIISIGDGEAAAQETLLPLLRRVQTVVGQFYRISLSFAISGKAPDYRAISDLYRDACALLQYRMVYGRHALLTAEHVQANIDNTALPINPQLEKRIIEDLKANRPAALRNHLAQLLEYASKLSYDHMQHAILHVFIVIRSAVTEMNNNRVLAIEVDWQDVHGKMFESETLDEIREHLHELFDRLTEQIRPSPETRTEVIIDTIKELVYAQYADPDLSLQSIADSMKMSSAYLGRLFRANSSVSLTEYMNDVRLSEALRLLENERYTINEIMEKVGYRTQSHFFKQFKNKYGTTPKEYRLKRSLAGPGPADMIT